MNVKKYINFLLFLMIGSFATCRFGIQHEINKIPLETREKMQEFDWIGIEWIGLGMIIQFLAVVSLILALVLRYKQRQIK